MLTFNRYKNNLIKLDEETRMPIITTCIQHESWHNEDETNHLWKKMQKDGKGETVITHDDCLPRKWEPMSTK